jgi:hypothetical protein
MRIILEFCFAVAANQRSNIKTLRDGRLRFCTRIPDFCKRTSDPCMAGTGVLPG